MPEGCDATHPVQRLEQLIGLFWDIGLDIGHSVRTSTNASTRPSATSPSRPRCSKRAACAGSRTPLFDDFIGRIARAARSRAFFQAKQLEQDERYARYNDTPYSLEPNCKESPGGLRDLQIILWIARAAGLGSNWRDLARHGLITADEARQLTRVENFLRDLRIRLHLLAGRREDRLLFDHQEALARACGCVPTSAKRACEVLMQRYYRNAKAVTQLNTILLQNLGASLQPAPSGTPSSSTNTSRWMRELLDVRTEDVFEREPRAILESFLLMQQHPEIAGMTRAHAACPVAARAN